MAVYYFPDGRASSVPTSKMDSVGIKHRFYDDEVKCTICGKCSLKYTANDKCKLCADLEAITFNNLVSMRKIAFKLPPIWVDEYGVRWSAPDRIARIMTDETWDMLSSYADKVDTEVGVSCVMEPCKTKGHIGVLKGSKCYLCEEERINFVSARQAAQRNGETWYMPTEPCSKCGKQSLRKVSNGQCSSCTGISPRSTTDLSARQQAVMSRQTWYQPIDECAKCGTTALRRVSNGECSGCTGTTPRIAENTSPRQQAVADGQSWYMPIDACPKCGKIALRRVSDGKCKGCVREEIETPEEIMMRECPDMVISRDDARAMGLKLYRTGKTCINGHTTWRYVSTGNCKLCINGKKG